MNVIRLQSRLRAAVAATAAALWLAAGPALAYDWLQYNGNAAHSGNNTAETTLTAANVASLVMKYQATLPTVADGAPVFLEAVAMPGGTKDLLFVTTKAGDTVALDAQTGTQVWIKQYPAGTCKINNGSSACYTTSSPAIDPNRQFVYAYGLDGKAHKLAVGNGVETVTGGWPQTTTLKGFDEKGSSALATATAGGVTYLYVVHGGYPGDNGDYQGHVTTINLATGAAAVFNTMCSNQTVHLATSPSTPACAAPRSAVWARPGVIYDAATNRIFVSTGNGSFNATTNWSESILAINPNGTGAGSGPVDSYTPTNFASLDSADADLGSTAPAILPVPANSNVQHLAVQAGKDAKLRLVNLANLSGLAGPGHTGGEIGTAINLPQGGGVLTQPAVWVDPAGGATWVFVANGSGISGLKLVVDASGNPSLSPQWQKAGGGFSPLVANNVLYYAGNNALRALAPTTGATLWTGTQIGGIHWQSPVVAKGVVYVTDQSGKLTAYALPGGTAPAITSANAATFVTGVAKTFTVTTTGTPVPTLSVTGTLPTGITFTPATGALAGTAATVGSYPLTFSAKNGRLPDAAQPFTLSVVKPPAGGAKVTYTDPKCTSFALSGTPPNQKLTCQ
ncbi:MAG: PQQ-binding-like beta-propeller repeat protein [Betaproteobacteria bacterium]